MSPQINLSQRNHIWGDILEKVSSISVIPFWHNSGRLDRAKLHALMNETQLTLSPGYVCCMC